MKNENEISRSVRRTVEGYLKDLDGEDPSGIYDMVMNCIEKPLLELVLHHAEGNQTRAAEMLGINRNTLRKKMQAYRIK